MSTTNVKRGSNIGNQKMHSKDNSRSVSTTEKEIAQLKSLLGPDGEDLSFEDMSDSVINEVLSSVQGNKSKGYNQANNKVIADSNKQTRIEQSHSAKRDQNAHRPIKRQESMTEDDWKWREPTDDENDSYRDGGGGLALKVHSSILDESVNISNLNVSFNAALQSRSHSATMRKKAQRNEQKVYCTFSPYQ